MGEGSLVFGDIPTVAGCMDPTAQNYMPTATLPCTDCSRPDVCECCKYDLAEVVYGCIDDMATNTSQLATEPCSHPDAPSDCVPCNFADGEGAVFGNTVNVISVSVGTGSGESTGGFTANVGTSSTYPYDINVSGAMCIRDTTFNTEWMVDVVKEGQTTTVYGNGFDNYQLQLENYVSGAVPAYVPNIAVGNPYGNVTTGMLQIWTFFDILLSYKPDHRVYINNHDYTPWIIPLYELLDPKTPNRHINQFSTDCSAVGGEIYTYNTISSSSLVGGTTDNYGYERNHFMACLCSDTTTPPQPSPCQTISLDGTISVLTASKAICVKDGDTFINFLNQNLPIPDSTNQGYLTPAGSVTTIPSVTGPSYYNGYQSSLVETPYFNAFLFTELGISVDDALFIIDNYWNYTPWYYPYNSQTLDTLNGSVRSREIIKNAFLAGANIWLPSDPTTNDGPTNVIKNSECCSLVGGIIKQGIYNTAYWNGKFLQYGIVQDTVCLCNTITPPCPTFADGLRMVTKDFESETGIITTTFIPNLTKECCSNESLQSTMAGNWTWDPINLLCVLINEEDSNACDESTIITISETPISLSNVNCLEDTVTITAYVYFEEPNNKCTDGKLTPDNSPLTSDVINLYKNEPSNAQEISRYSKDTWNPDADAQPIGVGQETGVSGPTSSTNCCYDTSTPIEGLLIVQNENYVKIDSPNITYVDTFISTQTTIATNANVGTGFNKWVKLTTVVDISNLPPNGLFNVAVEFTDGLFKCCDYDIYFDDIEVGCLQTGVREIYNTEKCPGFELRHVIDNKKSWVYNPGTNTMSDSVEDNIIRGNGTLGMNIAQSNPQIIDGGHGAINRVFAPSVDADLPFRDTDYFGFHGVIEKHSKLVLNSKEVILQFNMCPDDDCLINPGFLIDDYNNYVLDDDGGRIVVGPYTPFPNLLQLETFKKTFQGFWVQFMEQFIPATTIFVSGEKWCNSRICDQKIVSDYFLDIENDSGIISPTPTTETIPEKPNTNKTNTRAQLVPNTGVLGQLGSTTIGGQLGSTNTNVKGPLIVGNTKIYSLEALDPEEASKVLYKEYVT